MYKIIELLKSVRFWSIIAAIATIITAIPIVNNWILLKPKISIFIGEYEITDTDKPINIHFFIPFCNATLKSFLPIPIKISNTNKPIIDDFFIQFISHTERTTENGRILRMIFQRGYQANSKDDISQCISTLNKDLTEQYIDNLNNLQTLISEQQYSDLLFANMIDEKQRFTTNAWDNITITMKVGSKECPLQSYIFNIYCYYFHEDPISQENFIQSHLNDKALNYFIEPNLYKILTTTDGIPVYEYAINENNLHYITNKY